MSDCYYYKNFTLPRGSLDPSIDCMYILIMHGSDNETAIKKEIERAGIVSNVIFQYNLGYKKCNKNLKIKKTNHDIVHAVQTVFKDALKRNYERIMVLEEDCVFDERIRQETVINDINMFLMDKNPCVYNLGPFIHLSNPIDILLRNKHKRLFFNGGAHCNVYNREYIENKAYGEFYTAAPDIETNFYFSKYMYHKPLAYQLLKETENSKEGWGILRPISEFLFIKPSGIDRHILPGYDNINKTCDLISLIILLCFMLLLLFIL